MTKRDEWDDLLDDDVTVEVLGKTLTLRMPDREAMKRVKEMQVRLAGEGGIAPDPEAMASGLMDMMVEMIAACTGWDAEKAYKAYVRTGGESGELTRACQLMCGMQTPDALAQEALDPNS